MLKEDRTAILAHPDLIMTGLFVPQMLKFCGRKPVALTFCEA